MKNTGRKSVKGETTSAPKVIKATVAKNPVVATKPSPTREDIARRSYEIFLESGGAHGHDHEHWVQAEHELGG